MFVKYYSKKKTYQTPEPDDTWIKDNSMASFSYMRVINYLLLAVLLFGYAFLFANHKDMLDEWFQYFDSTKYVAGLIASLFIYAILHEFIHLIAMPTPQTDKHECRYFTFQGTLLAVFYIGEIKTKRYMLIASAPFFVLGGILVLMLLFTDGYLLSISWILMITHIGACIYDFRVILNLIPMLKYKNMLLASEGAFFK